MKNVVVLPGTLCVLIGIAVGQTPSQNQYQYPFQNPNLSIEERVGNIISFLTPEEKVDILGANYYLGRTPPSLNRLGIRGYNQAEGLHGLSRGRADSPNATKTTTFIQSIGLGETWDPNLIQKAAAEEGYEARWLNQTAKCARGGSQSLVIRAPNADLGRDPRWGRTEECYGEDAYLNGTLAAAFVRGLQGNDPKYWQTAALLKHFLANSNENGRKRTSSDFVKHVNSTVQRPVKELRGFQRITLQPNETRAVRLTVKGADLRYWDAGQHSFVVERGTSVSCWAPLPPTCGWRKRLK